MTKIGAGPKIQQTTPTQGVQQTGSLSTQQESSSTQMPQSFEPSQSVLAGQILPQANTQKPAGTIKAGLMGQGSFNVGQLMTDAKQSMDKLDQQINWRTGRMTGQLTEFFQQRPADQPPPIRAMYGLMPAPIDLGPGDNEPPRTELPPIRAMYGLMPGPGVDLEPPTTELPPIRAMYGLMPSPIIDGPIIDDGPGEIDLPIMQPMYGLIAPPEDWRPIIQPKYGLMRPPMMQAENPVNTTQQK